MSWIRDRFKISFFKEISRFLTSFACTLISCCSIVNDLREPQLAASLRSQAAFWTARLLYHILNRLSRGFSKVFLKIFAVFFRTGSRFFDPERKCPTIISHSLAFVKRFFKSFSTFFRDIFRLAALHRAAQCPVVSQLAYYSTFIPFCQHLFAKFFRFGSTSSIAQLSALWIV